MNSLNNITYHTLAALIAIFAPIQAVMITVGVLIFADLFTGVWAAMKRKEPVTSASLRRTISKMVIYQTAIVSGFLLESHIMGNVLPLTKLVASVIGLVEFKSILENGNFILGVDIFKELIKKLGSKNDQPPTAS